VLLAIRERSKGRIKEGISYSPSAPEKEEATKRNRRIIQLTHLAGRHKSSNEQKGEGRRLKSM